MLITDLLEELQKHGENNIEFHLTNYTGESSDLLEPYIIDGKSILKFKDINGNECDTVVLNLCSRRETGNPWTPPNAKTK